MTVSAVQGGAAEAGDAVLQRLRSAYERQGFSFVVEPGPDLLPTFLGPYRPDAIARRDGESVLIEVKRGLRSASDPKLAEIYRLIAGREHWKLDVVYATEPGEDAIRIPPPTLKALMHHLGEVRELERAGQARAAFVLGWSLLEASLNLFARDPAGRPRNAVRVVQSLAMAGYLGRGTERGLLGLSDLRNRVVHGDLDADVSGQDVERVLAALDEVLAAELQ